MPQKLWINQGFPVTHRERKLPFFIAMQEIIEATRLLLRSSEPVIMGILNVTPDSFSDGGEYTRVEVAVEQALSMVEQGAHIIDIGGESTRPGAEPVSVGEECERVLPVIRALRERSNIPISIDTGKPQVMREAVAAGASMVNDVNALRADGAVELCAALQVPVCLMHMQGEPRSMQHAPRYDDVVQEVKDFLLQRAGTCVRAGIDAGSIVLDPGFGFGKSLSHNLTLLTFLHRLCDLQYPVLAGLSRKSMLGAILDRPGADEPRQRIHASVAAAILAWQQGARWLRVHDVQATVDALKMVRATETFEG